MWSKTETNNNDDINGIIYYDLFTSKQSTTAFLTLKDSFIPISSVWLVRFIDVLLTFSGLYVLGMYQKYFIKYLYIINEIYNIEHNIIWFKKIIFTKVPLSFSMITVLKWFNIAEIQARSFIIIFFFFKYWSMLKIINLS